MKGNNLVFLALGTNLGNLEQNLREAITAISEFMEIQEISSFYKTEPVGFDDQDWFLNMALTAKTKLEPQTLLEKLQAIEIKMGRERLVKDGPRIIDLDIIFYNNQIIETPTLNLPHPELHNRNFVMSPLVEIAPDFIHPQFKVDLKSLFSKLEDAHQVELHKPFYESPKN